MMWLNNVWKENPLTMRKNATFVVLTLCALVSNVCCAGTAKQIGDFGRFATPIAALLLTLSKQDMEGAKQFSLSMASSLALTEGLKRTIHETRPNGGSNRSFPSGHVTTAFTSACYLQRRYGWQYGIPGLLVAGAVGYSRVEVRAHFVHDVIAAAALSTALTYLFTKPLQFGKVKTNTSTYANKGNIGFNLNIIAEI